MDATTVSYLEPLYSSQSEKGRTAIINRYAVTEFDEFFTDHGAFCDHAESFLWDLDRRVAWMMTGLPIWVHLKVNFRGVTRGASSTTRKWSALLMIGRWGINYWYSRTG